MAVVIIKFQSFIWGGKLTRDSKDSKKYFAKPKILQINKDNWTFVDLNKINNNKFKHCMLIVKI